MSTNTGITTNTGKITWRLSPRPRKTLATIHVIASVALLGEVWALMVLSVTALRTDDDGLAVAAYRLMETMVFAGGIPLSMIALISGILLGLGTPWRLFRHYWVVTKLVLLVATIMVGMFLVDPAALVAAMTGPNATAPSGQRWTQIGALAAQITFLTTSAALSVFKPRGRLRGRG